jgi:septum formation protein
MIHVVLASASPRRFELLSQLGVLIQVRPADLDEVVLPGEDPVAYVRRLSIEKAAAVAADDSDELIIAADTTVDLDGDVLGKPVDADDARGLLTRLAGRTHRVHTGVTVRLGGTSATDVTTTVVSFAPITPAGIDWYIATGEPFDKAGAYAIQGAGGVFVTGVQGSVSNVVGLPLTTVIDLARSIGIDLIART